MDKKSRKEMLGIYKERKVIGGVCAIKNTANSKMLLAAVINLQGYRNRFEFSKTVDGCVDRRLQDDWAKYGADAFVFEVLEELVKAEAQTDKEFKDDIDTLKEIYIEKFEAEMLY